MLAELHFFLDVLYCVKIQVPAPVRGEIVRQIGGALREKKQLLGQLVRELL
jgi:hypothetical protein